MAPRFIALIPTFLIVLHISAFHSHGSRLLPADTTNSPIPTTNAAELFVSRACGATIYQDLCFRSLSPYAGSVHRSPYLLARAALSVSFNGARSASVAVRAASTAAGGARMSPREAGAMGDCMENVGDSVEELRNSLGEMGNLRGKDEGYRINSIQTWVSAALTDDDTCMDGFAGKAMDGSVRTAVRGHVLNAARLTSNALALINAFAATEHYKSHSDADDAP